MEDVLPSSPSAHRKSALPHHRTFTKPKQHSDHLDILPGDADRTADLGEGEHNDDREEEVHGADVGHHDGEEEIPVEVHEQDEDENIYPEQSLEHQNDSHDTRRQHEEGVMESVMNSEDVSAFLRHHPHPADTLPSNKGALESLSPNSPSPLFSSHDHHHHHDTHHHHQDQHADRSDSPTMRFWPKPPTYTEQHILKTFAHTGVLLKSHPKTSNPDELENDIDIASGEGVHHINDTQSTATVQHYGINRTQFSLLSTSPPAHNHSTHGQHHTQISPAQRITTHGATQNSLLKQQPSLHFTTYTNSQTVSDHMMLAVEAEARREAEARKEAHVRRMRNFKPRGPMYGDIDLRKVGREL